MFPQLFTAVLAAWAVWFIFDGVRGFRKNAKAARESGLPWIIARKWWMSFLSRFGYISGAGFQRKR